MKKELMTVMSSRQEGDLEEVLRMLSTPSVPVTGKIGDAERINRRVLTEQEHDLVLQEEQPHPNLHRGMLDLKLC